MSSPFKLLEELRDKKEWTAEALKHLDLFLEASAIALRAIYESAHYGNVRCAEAVKQIEIKLRTK